MKYYLLKLRTYVECCRDLYPGTLLSEVVKFKWDKSSIERFIGSLLEIFKESSVCNIVNVSFFLIHCCYSVQCNY